MSEGEYKKISIGSTLKLLPPSTPMSTGFRVGDMMISISIEGTYPPDADPVKVRMDLEKFFTEIYRFPSVQMPKIIDGGVVELNRSIPPVMGASGTGKVSGSLSVGGTAQGGQGAGQGANTPNVNLSGMSAKPESKAESGQVAKPVAPPPANQPAQSANQPSAKNPEAGKVNLTPAVQGTPAGKPQPTPPKQEQGKHDQALEKLLAIFEKMRKEAPFSNLVFAEPTDDPSAYVDIERWLASDGHEGLMVRHPKDIYFLTHRVRRLSSTRERDKSGASGKPLITFDDWKFIMDYLYSRHWVTNPYKNHYELIPELY